MFLSFDLIIPFAFLRFSDLLPFKSPSEFDALSEEFIAYQLLEDRAIPEEVWSEVALSEEGESALVYSTAGMPFGTTCRQSVIPIKPCV